jgi:hypothetical protein
VWVGGGVESLSLALQHACDSGLCEVRLMVESVHGCLAGKLAVGVAAAGERVAEVLERRQRLGLMLD